MGGYTPKQLVIYAIIGMVVVAIIYFTAGALGIAIPSFFVNIVWALVIGFVAIAAVVFLFSMAKPGP